jgi:pilus assembly protein Flp/PilA
MKDLLRRFWTDESGQGLTEYALILALVSIGLILILVIFRDSIGVVFDRVATALQGVDPQGYKPTAVSPTGG